MSGRIWAIAGKLKRFSKRAKDLSYESFVRRFPCVACGSAKRIEVAHLGPRGLAQKTSSFTVLPLCAMCHREGKQALHVIGPERFWMLHHRDHEALQAMFNGLYAQKTGQPAKGWPEEIERRKAA